MDAAEHSRFDLVARWVWVPATLLALGFTVIVYTSLERLHGTIHHTANVGETAGLLRAINLGAEDARSSGDSSGLQFLIEAAQQRVASMDDAAPRADVKGIDELLRGVDEVGELASSYAVGEAARPALDSAVERASSVATNLLRTETEKLSAAAHLARQLAIVVVAVLAVGTLVGSLALRWSGQVVERLRAAERESRDQIRAANSQFIETNANLEAANERLAGLVRLDQLTGLLNRATFLAELGDAIASARRDGEGLAVLFVDLDRFKTFNDTRGHLAGDELLCSTADRLATNLGKSDGAARLGGDEFALFLHAHDSPAARVRAERVVASLAEPLPFSGGAQLTTASVGVSLFPDDGATPEKLIQHADLALYAAKRRGGDTRAYFTPAMAESAQERSVLESTLRWAVQLGEFEVHYQPIVRVDDGRICGVEALVRWRHPELGLVSPGVFIPVAEDTGLIFPLGEQVMRQALGQTRRWREMGITEIKTGINVSPRQLRTGLADQILAALSDFQLEPTVLSIEITEAWAVADVAMAAHELGRLRDAGVGIALDDFGLEHSSLGRIKQLPLDILKIDREFIQEIASDGESAAVVEAAIRLGHALGMQVVAEGVETEAQLDRLAALGCDFAQGFLLSKPQPAEALTPLLQAGYVVPSRRAA